MSCKQNACIQTQCPQRKKKRGLTLKRDCVVAAGVYENVTVEINEYCQVVRLEPCATVQIRGCDSCA